MPGTLSLVHRFLDQAFNQGELEVVDDLVAADAVAHLTSWGAPASRLGLKQMIASLRSAFPDLHCTIEDEVREVDKIAAHWTMRGIHKGMYFGNLPTGKPIEVQGFMFARIARGQIGENWILIDQMGLLQQLGIVPPPKGVG